MIIVSKTEHAVKAEQCAEKVLYLHNTKDIHKYQSLLFSSKFFVLALRPPPSPTHTEEGEGEKTFLQTYF